MDIFDLNIEEFEKRIEEILDNISSEELLEELIDNGLIIDSYTKKSTYIEEKNENVWVHKSRESKMDKIKFLLNKRNIKNNILEAV